MAKVVVKKMSRRNVREAFRERLHEFDYEYNKKLVKIVEELAEEKLGQTLEYRDTSGKKFLKTAEILTKTNISEFKKNKNNHNVKYHIYVVEKHRSGKPHMGWHILNYGRKRGAGRFSKPVAFPFRKELRTKPYSLKVKPFAGWKDEWGYFKENDKTPPMKARSWYNRFVNSNLKSFFNSKYLKNSVDIVGGFKINKPKGK